MCEDMETGYRLGCEAYSREDYATALKMLEPIASKGHSKAQYLLGCLHDQGSGTDQNDEDALKWFRLAAEQGNPDAQFALGEKYLTGKGVPHDIRAAARWYILAHENGHQETGDLLDEMFYSVSPDCITEAMEALRRERAEQPGRSKREQSGARHD